MSFVCGSVRSRCESAGRRKVKNPTNHNPNRRSRSRRGRSISRFKLVTRAIGLFLLLTAIGIGAHRLFLTNSDFAVAELEVETDGSLTQERILRFADLETGGNIFQVDLRKIQSKLTSHPQVETASVERVLPHTLRIRVAERQVVARLSVPHLGIMPNHWGLDRKGVPVRLENLSDELPIVHADIASRIQSGIPVDLAPIRTAAQVAGVWNSPHQPILAFEINSPYSVEAIFGEGLQVTFATTNLKQQLDRLGSILEMAAARNQQVATVNLLPQKNIPVTFKGITPKSVKPPSPLLPVSGN